MIRLYLKILVKFVRLILQDRLCVEHISSVHTVKFKFLSQFPVGHPAHPLVSSFILFMC